MKDKKFSEKLREAQIKLQIKTQADMAEKLGIKPRTLQDYLKGDQDHNTSSVRVQAVLSRIEELIAEKQMGISFPQKDSGITGRVARLEAQIKKMNTLIDDLYEKLDAVQKQLPISQK